MPPPNLILVIADDLAPGDLGAAGNAQAHTPHLDRLVREGVQLLRHCSGPLCTPARAALFTGRHPYRTRAFDTYLGRSQLDPGEITLADVLRSAGYATGLFGKWHLGDRHPCRPQDHGFDEVLMHCGGGLHQPCDPGRASYFHPDLMHNGRLERHAGYCTDVFFDSALAWMETRAATARPFFAYIATNVPHTPLYVGERWSASFRSAGLSEELARLYGMVANLDHQVGRVRAWLDRHDLVDDTILIFTSDHGPCRSVRTDRFNCGLRGKKGSLYEGGIRVPALIHWPHGGWIGDRRLEAPTNPIDWLPTLAAAAGIHPPADRAIDGIDLGAALSGRDAESLRHRHLVMQWHRGPAPERLRNCAVIGQRFKWIRPEIEDASPTRGRCGRREELYDVMADPGEAIDIAADHPAIVASCRAIYESWFTDVSTTRPENFSPPPIALGSAAEPLSLLTWQDWRPEQEGWSADNPGPWLVEVAAAEAYEITVEFDRVRMGDEIEVACGNTAWRHPVVDDRYVQYHFESIPLAVGRQTLTVLLHPVEGPVRGPLRVFVHRSAPTPACSPGSPPPIGPHHG